MSDIIRKIAGDQEFQARMLQRSMNRLVRAVRDTTFGRDTSSVRPLTILPVNNITVNLPPRFRR